MVNRTRLRGRIVEMGSTIKDTSRSIGVTSYSLGQKISNKAPMKLEEVHRLCDVLEIPPSEIPAYFFVQEVAKCNERSPK